MLVKFISVLLYFLGLPKCWKDNTGLLDVFIFAEEKKVVIPWQNGVSLSQEGETGK
jgi:hypothetical protein